MRFLKYSIFTLLYTMTQFNTAVAQIDSHNSIKWELAALLPSSSDGREQLGLAGPITGIHKNFLMVGGGANFPDAMPWFGGRKRYYDDLFLFVKDENGKIVSCNKVYKLPFPIAYGASCNTPHGIVYAGGENEKGLSNKVLLIQWNESTKNVDFKKLPQLPFAVANASITAIKNKVYIAGGELSDTVSDIFMVLDLDNLSKGWQNMSQLPYQVSHSVMVSHTDGINDYIYIVGGRKRNTAELTTFYPFVFRFDISTGLWSKKADLPYGLSAGTGTIVDNKSILLFGGDRGETFHKAESLILSINNESNLLEKERLNQEKIKVQTNHSGFSRTILEYNTREDTWSAVDSMLFDTPVTTNSLIWGDRIVIPSGEIKAGVRTPYILSGQLK